MQVIRSRDYHRIEISRVEKLVDVREDVRNFETLSERNRLGTIVVADRHELRATHAGKKRKMRELRKAKLPYVRREIGIDDAISYMSEAKQPFKVELLNLLKEKGTTAVAKGDVALTWRPLGVAHEDHSFRGGALLTRGGSFPDRQKAQSKC